jgi:flagella basal body P-ring formation protein FlgA
VRLAERDIVGRGCEPLTALDARTRWRATTRLSSGEMLCARGVEPAPDVERARKVVLSAQRGGIEVSRVLVAADDARAGERVRLTDSSSGDVFVAIVTGAGTARAPTPGENP